MKGFFGISPEVGVRLLVPLICVSCMSSGDGNELKTELFSARNRILELEEKIEKSGEETRSTEKNATMKLASARIRMDKLDETLRRIQGSLDTLRRGVITGELPGMESQPDSVAKAISRLEERLTELERTQIEILTLIQAKKDKGHRKKRPPLQNLSGMTKAFDKKQYLYVVEDGPSIVRKLAKKELAYQARFLIAESQFRLGLLRDAALSFNALAAEEALPDKGPHISSRLGDSFRLLGDKKAAMMFYKEVIARYPDSGQAPAARGYLKKLRPEGAD